MIFPARRLSIPGGVLQAFGDGERAQGIVRWMRETSRGLWSMIFDIQINFKCLVQNVQYCVYIFILCMDYDVLIIGTLWLNYSIWFLLRMLLCHTLMWWIWIHPKIWTFPKEIVGWINPRSTVFFHLQWSTNGDGPNGSRIPTIEVLEASELVTPKSTNPQEWYLSCKSKSSYILVIILF